MPFLIDLPLVLTPMLELLPCRVIGREAGNDKSRMAELSMALRRRLVELAADGVTDPHELRRLALESFPLTPPPQKETAPGDFS
jgi:hypothetical protein